MLMRRTIVEARILKLARRYGVDTSGIVTRQSLLARTAPDAELEALAQVVRELRRVLNDELLGMTARPVPAGTFDIVMKSALHCRSLGEVLLELIAAAELMYSPPDLHCRIERREDRVAIVYENAHRPDDDFYFAYAAMATHRGMSWLIDERIRLQQAQFCSERHRHLPDLQHIFQCPVALAQPRNAIIFDAQYLDAPIRRGAAELQAYLHRRPLDVLYLAGSDRSLAGRVQQRLEQALQDGRGMPELAALAASLGTTTHGLRRQLAREGHTLQQLKDQVRHVAAAQQLRHSTLPVERIAELLGFAEPNSFCRAFKRWAGLAPQAYRRRNPPITGWR